jgi:hypothetical protein
VRRKDSWEVMLSLLLAISLMANITIWVHKDARADYYRQHIQHRAAGIMGTRDCNMCRDMVFMKNN